MARPCFSRVSYTRHFLFALLAAPVHLFSNRLALVKRLDQSDRGMIRTFPGLGRYAWQNMLELEHCHHTCRPFRSAHPFNKERKNAV
jgi:hypothetical protein